MKEFPSVEKMADYVRNHEKRVGMRMIYREFGITEPEDREKLRQLWDAFHVKLPDAYGKETENASRDRETTQDDGDSAASAGETVQAEPEDVEDE